MGCGVAGAPTKRGCAALRPWGDCHL